MQATSSFTPPSRHRRSHCGGIISVAGDWDTCVLCRRQPEAIDATYDHSRARFHAGLRVGNDRVCAAIMPSTSSDLGGCHVIRVGHSAAGAVLARIAHGDDRQHSVRQRPRRLRDCGRDRTDVSLCHTEWRTDVAQGRRSKGCANARPHHCDERDIRDHGCLLVQRHDLWRLSHRPISAQCQSMDRLENAYRPFREDRGVGIPYVPAAYGSEVWISEQPPGPAVIFYSRDSGRSFQKLITPELGSVNACGLIPESAVALWAECPTGMQESFFYSKNAGTSWTQIPQQQFFGTGGGFFDPVSASLGYLDYGAMRPLVRITTSPRTATKVGVLSCSKIDSSVNGLIFTNAHDGLALCSPGDGQSLGRLERTINGGRTWRSVALPLK